jgi:hypothetical protein
MKKILTVGSVIALCIAVVPNIASAAEAPLTLATASTYGVLANTAVTNATASSLTGTAGGNVGVAGGTAPTGVITYSGSLVLAGASIAAMTSASSALADNRGGTASVVELGGGRTITPGAYTGGTFEVNGSLTLDAQGDANAIFIFRTATTLTTGISSSVLLTGGAQACNIYWQVGSSATLGASSTIAGHVIASASISTGLASTVNGQLIATTGAVTLGGTTITNTACVTPVVVAPVVATPVATVISVAATANVIETGTVNVIKTVVNKFSGSKVASDFYIRIEHLGVEIAGSPSIGLGFPGKPIVLPVGTYLFSELATDGYRGVWTGDITYGGRVVVTKGGNITVTRTNYDDRNLPEAVATATPSPTATPTATPSVTPTPEPTTETGGVLPDTSTPIGNMALVGAVLVALGGIGFASRKSLVK